MLQYTLWVYACFILRSLAYIYVTRYSSTTRPNSNKLYRNLLFMTLYKNATEGVKIDKTTTTKWLTCSCAVNTSPLDLPRKIQ